jgi:hypothetical protein
LHISFVRWSGGRWLQTNIESVVYKGEKHRSYIIGNMFQILILINQNIIQRSWKIYTKYEKGLQPQENRLLIIRTCIVVKSTNKLYTKQFFAHMLEPIEPSKKQKSKKDTWGGPVR